MPEDSAVKLCMARQVFHAIAGQVESENWCRSRMAFVTVSATPNYDHAVAKQGGAVEVDGREYVLWVAVDLSGSAQIKNN